VKKTKEACWVHYDLEADRINYGKDLLSLMEIEQKDHQKNSNYVVLPED
jgi:hypothetical protein